MVAMNSDRERLSQRAKQIYDERIRASVEPAHVGEFVVVDVDSGDYEVGAEMLAVFDALKARRPDATTFVMRAGYPTAVTLGGARHADGRR